MKIKATKAFKYSNNGHTILSAVKGNILVVSETLGEKLVTRGDAAKPTKKKTEEK